MGFSLIPQNTRDLWKEWELRSLVLLSLFLQLTLATQASRRKSIVRYRIQFVVWTTYLLADSIATITLGVLSNRLANIKETKGIIDPKSQITAFWAPFLLLHLGGPDTITAFALEDNELWLRQLARFCVQVGLACYIYFLALWDSTLWILAASVILVGFIKYAERTLCLYLASEGRVRDSMLSRPDFGPIYPRKMVQSTLKKEEGYRVEIRKLTQIPAPDDLLGNSGQAGDKEKDRTLAKAYDLFKIFKVLFVGLTINFVHLDASKSMFKGPDIKAVKAFEIVEIELGFMYDLLYTKTPLLNCAWGITRLIISLSTLCAVLVFFSSKDKKVYPNVDIWITFLLISVAILLEIFSLLLAISSDRVNHWRIQRPGRSTISSAITFLSFIQSQRWSNSVAQVNLLGSSIRKRNSIFPYQSLPRLGELVDQIFYIDYEELKDDIKELIFHRMKETATEFEDTFGLRGGVYNFKLEGGFDIFKMEAVRLLRKLNCDNMKWSFNAMEFDQSILVWHIVTELCHYEDCHRVGSGDVTNYMMSMLVSRYMLYVLIFHPSMLPTGIGMLRYEDTSVEAQKFFEDELAMLSKKEGSISSVVIEWAHKLFKKAHVHTHLCNCFEKHGSRESRDLCEVCYLLLQVRTDHPAWKMRASESTSVLFDACHLAIQLKSVDDRWNVISKLWVRMLMYAACQCKGYEHRKSLSRGGELLSHVWLLTAHLGIAQPVQTSGAPCITKLNIK